MRCEADEAIDYISSLFCDENLERVRNSAPESSRNIQISPVEGRIIQVILRMAGVKTVVEIGSFVGYSTVCIANAIPPDGSVYSIEISPENCASAIENHRVLGLTHKIIQLNGSASDILPALEDKAPFDALFIDADKQGYYDYLAWADVNIKAGGLIIADNTLSFGKTQVFATSPQPNASWSAMRIFNQMLSDRTKYDAIILPTFSGLMIARKL